MSTTIVVVFDKGETKFGGITLTHSSGQAERLLETLLQAECEPERIRVFSGEELNVQVGYRPVVSLSGEVPDEPDDVPTRPGARGPQREWESLDSGERISSLFREASAGDPGEPPFRSS